MKKKRARQVKRANDVFLDLGFPPHEAAVMLLRCELAEALRKWMDRERRFSVEAHTAPWCGPAPHLRNRAQQGKQEALSGLPRRPVCKGWCLSRRETGRPTKP